MKIGTARSFVAIIGIIAAACASAALPITGTFSDLRYVEESGDLVGTEIRIAAAGDGYQAVVQFAEGAPGELTTVPVIFAPAGEEQSELRFDLPSTSPYAGRFLGRVTRQLLEGEFVFASGGRLAVRLPRRTS